MNDLTNPTGRRGPASRWKQWWPAVVGAVAVGIAAGVGLFALLGS